MGSHVFAFPKWDRTKPAPKGPDSEVIQYPHHLPIPGLYCPRVPPPVYFAIRDLVVDKLSALFENVVVPLEHPEKRDYGDIDLLLCGFKGDRLQKCTIYGFESDIAKAFGVTRSRCNGVGVGYFAIPVQVEVIALAELHVTKDGSIFQLGSNNEYWIQVDMEVVDASSQLEWSIFQTAHATFKNILKYGLRPAGLVFRSNGL